MMEQPHVTQEEAGRLWAHLETQGAELRELHVMALCTYRALFLRGGGVRDNMTKVNEWLRTMPVHFHEAIEDGIR